jgi:hypothetical protein
MATMSVEHETPARGSEAAGRRLSILLPPEHRFRVVVETALRIYLRPICHGSEPAPQLADELAAMIDEIAASEPLEVVFSCRRPSLEITVRSGDRSRARRWRIAPDEEASAR